MDPHGSHRSFAILAWMAFAASLAAFTWIAFEHARFAGFTETMEGDVLQSIERISGGLEPFPKPSGEFISLCYMPLYYYAAAPLYRLFGDSLAGPRLLSTVCAAAAGLLVAWIASREARSRTVGVLAGAFFFSAYRVMDYYLTCVLPDSLFLLFLVVGWALLAYGKRPFHDVLWIACFSLAFWTKQHGALFLVLAGVYALVWRENHLPRWGILLGILLGGPVAYFTVGPFLGERFFFHTFVEPGRWDQKLIYSIRRMAFVLACYAPVLVLLTAGYMQRTTRPRLKLTPAAWFAAASLLISLYTMRAAGSSNNHYVPFFAGLAVTAALGVHSILEAGAPKRLGAVTLAVAAGSAVATWLASRMDQGHAVPVQAPFALAAAGAVCFAADRWARSEGSRRSAIAAAFVAAQLATVAYCPSACLPDARFGESLARLRSETMRLDAPLFWLPYGNIPAALTGPKLARAPSWVALEDVERQVGAEREAEADLAPFFDRMRGIERYYVLSASRIEDVPVWKDLAQELELVQDFEGALSGLKQGVSHWFSGRDYPRFLYRKKKPPETAGGLRGSK